jgi:hypothetical protein
MSWDRTMGFMWGALAGANFVMWDHSEDGTALGFLIIAFLAMVINAALVIKPSDNNAKNTTRMGRPEL